MLLLSLRLRVAVSRWCCPRPLPPPGGFVAALLASMPSFESLRTSANLPLPARALWCPENDPCSSRSSLCRLFVHIFVHHGGRVYYSGNGERGRRFECISISQSTSLTPDARAHATSAACAKQVEAVLSPREDQQKNSWQGFMCPGAQDGAFDPVDGGGRVSGVVAGCGGDPAAI